MYCFSTIGTLPLFTEIQTMFKEEITHELSSKNLVVNSLEINDDTSCIYGKIVFLVKLTLLRPSHSRS